jgi:hypothetical protein
VKSHPAGKVTPCLLRIPSFEELFPHQSIPAKKMKCIAGPRQGVFLTSVILHHGKGIGDSEIKDTLSRSERS